MKKLLLILLCLPMIGLVDRRLYKGMVIDEKCWDKFGNIDKDCSAFNDYINSLKNED